MELNFWEANHLVHLIHTLRQHWFASVALLKKKNTHTNKQFKGNKKIKNNNRETLEKRRSNGVELNNNKWVSSVQYKKLNLLKLMFCCQWYKYVFFLQKPKPKPKFEYSIIARVCFSRKTIGHGSSFTPVNATSITFSRTSRVQRWERHILKCDIHRSGSVSMHQTKKE